jgi:transposase
MVPAVAPITALTWVLEVGEVQRFSSIKKAISYYGLCGAEESSAKHRVAHSAVEAAQQAFTDDLDRGGEVGAPKQPGAGHALR